MLVKMDAANVGGGDKYDSQNWIDGSTSSSSPTVFTTKGKAKAIWIARYITASPYNNKSVTYTNVNPTTGEINNEDIYSYDSTIADPDPQTIDFIVSDNQITFSGVFTALAHKLQLNYTY